MFALIFSMAIGIATGVIAAVNHRTGSMQRRCLVRSDRLPNFHGDPVDPAVLVYEVATGDDGRLGRLLPASLGRYIGAILARLTRSSMLEVLRSEYITTARAKGVAEQAVILRHALRNSLIPVVTTLGIELGRLLAGAIIIETVFARPGIGRLLLGAISAKDAPVVQGTIIFSAVIFVLINLLVDLSYGFLDPRIDARSEPAGIENHVATSRAHPQRRPAERSRPRPARRLRRALRREPRRDGGRSPVADHGGGGDRRAADCAVRPARGRSTRRPSGAVVRALVRHR
jgi:hypothetical protein